MRWRVLAAAALLAFAGAGDGAGAAPPRPNVLLILSDDQAWGDLSSSDNHNLATPRIDSLAADGARFEHFYVSPLCSPTRAELLTGRYHPRGGVYGTSARAERLDLDERLLSQVFKDAGYATGAFGKWHNGSQFPYHPNARGFDEFYGFTAGHWARYFDPPLDHNGERVRGHGFIADDLTDHAIAFIDRHRSRPFFCYLPFNTPHSPMQVPDRFYDRLAGSALPMRYDGAGTEDLANTRAALAMVENLDWNVGRMLDRLDTLGLADNTVVIFLSDNGPAAWRWNGGLKGRKGSLDEGGIRVPFMMRWPGHIRRGLRVPQVAAAIDMLPTLADLTGIPVGRTRKLDGRSLKPLLLGSPAPWPARNLFTYWNDAVTVRTERYRLDAGGRLFDMMTDPGQHTDVAGQHPDTAAALRQAAAAMRRELTTELGMDNRPLPVGGAPRTELPAGDGVASGGVERSTRYPNSSYFRRWTSTGAALTWDIDVLAAGDYEANIYYAVAAADRGATMDLEFRGTHVTADVTEPNDPPLLGAAEDRVPRIESYDKDFKPMSLGTMRLEAGRGPLTLKALRIPGQEAPEISAVALTRRSIAVTAPRTPRGSH